jgi:hypothetical protein
VFRSHAAITTYTDRALFEAALTGLNPSYERFDENLNGFSSDVSFHSSSLALNGFSIAGFGASSSTINLVDTSPFESSGKQSFDTSSYLRLHHFESTRGYTVTFSPGALAWGADVVDTERASSNLNLSDGTTLDFPTTGASNTSFIGFISDQQIFSMTSVGGVTGDAIGIDNVTTVLVPEPSSAGIFVGSIALVMLLRRQRFLTDGK